MKAHIGEDGKEKIIHAVTVCPANAVYSVAPPHLPHGKETRVYADQAFRGQEDAVRQRAPKANDLIDQRD